MAYELLSQSRKLNKREEWGEGAPNNSGRVGNPQRRGGGRLLGTREYLQERTGKNLFNFSTAYC